MIKFLGYDPGTIKAGWGIIDDDLFHHASGLIETDKKYPMISQVERWKSFRGEEKGYFA